MARHLIVAHQTAASRELIERVKELAGSDADAEFVLLVPATPTSHLLTWEEGEAKQLAGRRAREASEALRREAGVELVAAKVGSHSPLEAVGDELQASPGYASIVLSTFPPGLSRWLRGDLPNQLRRRYRLPVEHVVAAPSEAPTHR
jgi:nucleotide-binding universal stress UspA family protein